MANSPFAVRRHAIGKPRIERVRPGLPSGRYEGPFNHDRARLGKRFGATYGLDVLLNELLRILRGCGSSEKGETNYGY